MVARGGNPKRRSGRHTKPGPRPRATPVLRARKAEPGAYVRRVSEAMKAAMGPTYEPTGGFLIKNLIYQSQPQTNYYYQTWPQFVNTDTTSSSTITISDNLTSANIYIPNNTLWSGSAFTTDATYSGHIIQQQIIVRDNVFLPDDQIKWIDSVPGLTKEQQAAYDKQQKIIYRKHQLHDQMLVKPPTHNGRQVRAIGVDFGQAQGPELVALSLLKSLVQEVEWRRYLKYGFVTVQGQSGLIYKIGRGSHVMVYRKGKKIAELCVYVQGNVPPTDSVIARKIMVEVDEKDIWARANIHNPVNDLRPFLPAYGQRPQITEQQLQMVASA